ncbi:hypothetical protein O0555_21095 [Brevibacillus laterosporus]|uniref:hypothetical protein n=1 Tax=Brevibacillus laterosporus TaxID=1465 RepID=UPI00215C2209|nr:hypothetical protein [Brevibacillus laterosporus]MCR8939800.1 hypothetical protein [Brevibacillus laterosporus]MCZ0842440.1 hypothetical protein [Brevibacillus laterosporus]MCZ0846437.1 hypothetical protein [Brevibacillus laterosporus]
MSASEQQIADIDWEIDRIKRQLIELTEKNNVLESDLVPGIERLRLGRIEENVLKHELYNLGNVKMKLGWKSHASS